MSNIRAFKELSAGLALAKLLVAGEGDSIKATVELVSILMKAAATNQAVTYQIIRGVSDGKKDNRFTITVYLNGGAS